MSKRTSSKSSLINDLRKVIGCFMTRSTNETFETYLDCKKPPFGNKKIFLVLISYELTSLFHFISESPFNSLSKNWTLVNKTEIFPVLKKLNALSVGVRCRISNHVDSGHKTRSFTFVFINVLVGLSISGIHIVYNLLYSITNNSASST